MTREDGATGRRPTWRELIVVALAAAGVLAFAVFARVLTIRIGPPDPEPVYCSDSSSSSAVELDPRTLWTATARTLDGDRCASGTLRVMFDHGAEHFEADFARVGRVVEARIGRAAEGDLEVRVRLSQRIPQGRREFERRFVLSGGRVVEAPAGRGS